MALPLSSPSESSLLAFAYDRGVDEVNYPPGHDQSQPQTPASDSTTRPFSHMASGHGGHLRKHSLSSLDASRLSSQSKRPSLRDDEEYEIGDEIRREESGSEMEPFSNGELVLMSGSSLVVLILIAVSLMMALGKTTL